MIRLDKNAIEIDNVSAVCRALSQQTARGRAIVTFKTNPIAKPFCASNSVAGRNRFRYDKEVTSIFLSTINIDLKS
jgi:hypothetical protein